MSDMAPKAVAVVALEPYVVRVLFEDGRVRDLDIEPVLDGPVFRALRDPSRFAQVYINEWGGVTWDGDLCEVDLDPDVVYGDYPEGWEPKIRMTTRL